MENVTEKERVLSAALLSRVFFFLVFLSVVTIAPSAKE